MKKVTWKLVHSSFFLALFCWVISCTIYDYAKSRKKDKSQRNGLMMAFSLTSNWKNLMRMDRSPTDIECIHGIKIISAFLIVLGHRLSRTENFFPHRFHDDWFLWQFFVNAIKFIIHSTDIFFTVSGFLVVRSLLISISQ